MSGAAIVSLSLAPKSHKNRVPVTIQRDEALGKVGERSWLQSTEQPELDRRASALPCE